MKTYEEVAEKNGMSLLTKKRYILYMRSRWSNEEELQCKTGYAEEWADRFLNQREYECSDSKGKSILEDIDKNIV